MKIRLAFILILCHLSLMSIAQTKMDASEALAFRTRIATNLKNVKSITSDFVQSKHTRLLKQPITSSGKMYFQQPGTIKWQYIKPNQFSAMFKNGVMYIDDNGKKSEVQLRNNKNFDQLSKLLNGTLDGSIFDSKDFVIEYFRDGAVFIAKFIPKKSTMKQYFQSAELFFNGNETTVSKIKMTEPNSDYTLIQFSQKKINTPIDASVFKK